MAEGLVGGEDFAVDASMIKATPTGSEAETYCLPLQIAEYHAVVGLRMTPSGATPVVTSRQNAMSNLRAITARRARLRRTHRGCWAAKAPLRSSQRLNLPGRLAKRRVEGANTKPQQRGLHAIDDAGPFRNEISPGAIVRMRSARSPMTGGLGTHRQTPQLRWRHFRTKPGTPDGACPPPSTILSRQFGGRESTFSLSSTWTRSTSADTGAAERHVGRL